MRKSSRTREVENPFVDLLPVDFFSAPNLSFVQDAPLFGEWAYIIVPKGGSKRHEFSR
jgi:hypothetical protein